MLRPIHIDGVCLVMLTIALLLFCSSSVTASNRCQELNGGLLNRSACEVLSADHTDVDCCRGVLDPYSSPSPPVATSVRLWVRNSASGGTCRFCWRSLLPVAILLQAPPNSLPTAHSRLVRAREHAPQCAAPPPAAGVQAVV